MMTNKTTMPEPTAEIRTVGNVTIFDLTPVGKQQGLSIGQKFITTDQAEAYANARVEKVLEELRKLSDGAYCRYIDTLYRDECLGWEAKVKDGRFGEREFNAHKKAHEFLGQHRAFAEAIITIRALIPKDPPCDT